MINVILALILSIIMLAPAAPHYAAPYGAGTDCTASAPCALGVALASGGDIWLLPGVYAGDVIISVPDTYLRSAPGARARIDGGVTITGAGVTVEGLEIADSSWTNRASPTAAQQARSVSVQAQNVSLRDNRIHDLAGGIYAFNGSGGYTAGLVARDNLIYNIGYGASLGRGTGHAIYVQNDSAGAKLFQGNILLNQYGFGMHAYGSSGPSAQLDHLTFDGNIQVNNRMLVGGGRPLRDTHITNNRLWQSQLQVGYSNQHNEDVTITGNWVGNHRLQAQWVYTPTVQLNRIVAPANDQVVVLFPVASAGAWDANSYYRPTPNSAPPFGIDGQGYQTFAQWQSTTGWDATSTYTATMPLENWIEVTPTAPHRGRIVIYNWLNTMTVTLDLAPLNLTPGASYRLVNAGNPAETQAVVGGSAVSLSMDGWTFATPYGASSAAAWDRRFGVFLVEPI